MFACTMLFAGALACGSLVAPSQAAERPASSAPQWQPVFDLGDDDDERAQTRDLRPSPGRPGARPRVTLRPSSPVVRIGMPINFQLGSSVKGFAHVYVVSASGRVQVWMENVPIDAGEHVLFPTRGSIKAAPPAGRDDIVLIVTKDRINGFVGYRTTRTPRDLNYNPVAFKRAVRDRFTDLPRRDWGYARTLVRVVNRAGPDGDWDWDSDETN
jgi:hypothetical protein